MSAHYKTPLLLIEFEGDRAFALQARGCMPMWGSRAGCRHDIMYTVLLVLGSDLVPTGFHKQKCEQESLARWAATWWPHSLMPRLTLLCLLPVFASHCSAFLLSPFGCMPNHGAPRRALTPLP